TQHLLGTDGLDPALASLVAGPQTSHVGDADALARAIGRGARLCYLRGRPDGAGAALGAAALAQVGRAALVLDFERLGGSEDTGACALAAFREARLRGAGLVAGPVERLLDLGVPAIRLFAAA